MSGISSETYYAENNLEFVPKVSLFQDIFRTKSLLMRVFFSGFVVEVIDFRDENELDTNFNEDKFQLKYICKICLIIEMNYIKTMLMFVLL